MQQRTLFRARDLAAFRQTLAVRALEGAPLAARRRIVVVPTRAAAELLRRTLERRAASAGAAALLLPEFVTRAELVERLAEVLPGRPRVMPRIEREVLLERAAREAARRPRLGGAPFPLRPGLVAAMLDFYDELRRRQRTVRRFAEALFEELRGERGLDRGTDSLIQQTAFLGFAFLAYQRGLRESGALDEHLLHDRLLETQPKLPFDHLIVAVADHPSDPRGLWPADFDLIGRLQHLSTLDVVITDNLHDAGFRERIERELPGIVEERRAAAGSAARLQRPAGAASDRIAHVSRDREEELRDVVRIIRMRAAGANGVISGSTAITFHRPLPYLYLAQQVLAEGRVPYLAFDALPLAAEPYAALLDVVLTFARSGGTRESAIELLRSGLLTFEVDGAALTGREVAALDTVLAERRSLGDAASFGAEVDGFAASSARQARVLHAPARRAAAAAAAAREELRPFCDAASASAQLDAIAAFLRRHERVPSGDPELQDRHRRARAAVHGALQLLSEACALHDDRPREPEHLTAAIRHAIEAQTFTPRRGRGGVHLVDAVAARFGDFDHVHIVGLVETDWPERPRRSVFYTAGLLRALGWPQETDQMRVQHAEFSDLLQLPSRTLMLHAFQLEGDAIVATSPLLELARDLPAEDAAAVERRRVFDDELLTSLEVPATLDPGVGAWLALRARRPPLTDRRLSGFVDPRPAGRYRVSRVDHYVDCPFRYFAENVLGLPEERDEFAGLTPLERGNLVHELFEQFYRAWDGEGRGSITAANLPEAVATFADLTERALARFPEADRALERTRLLGSLVAPGVAERVFQLEADDPGVVVARLLETELKGPFVFPRLGGFATATIEISGKADRIDVLQGGQLRVVDYKLSRLPDTSASIQIAVYAHAARQWLEKRDSRPYTIAEAMYLAFGDEDRFEGRLGSRDNPAAIAVEVRAADFAGVIGKIEAGRFPPQPRRVSDCQWCRFAGVCRKEYYEDDEAAESV